VIGLCAAVVAFWASAADAQTPSLSGRVTDAAGVPLPGVTVGARDLVEDGSVRSRPTSVINGDATYQITPRLRVALFNLANAEVSDIDYYFVSRLPGEPREGVADFHFHPAIPRTVRVASTVTF
jgi:hypothetical protein